MLVRAIRYLGRKNPDFIGLLDGNLLMLDGVDHRRLRGLVSQAFTPRRVAKLRPRVEVMVDELLDEAAEEDEIDLVSRIAHRVPVAVIGELLGVLLDDREKFLHWSTGMIGLLDPLQGSGGAAPMMDAIRGLNEYFRPLLAERRAAPRDDLLSAMIAAEDEGQKPAEADLLALASLLLVAGHETTSNLIGNAVIALLQNPGERKRLTDDLALLPSAVDEFLRYDSPILLTDRAAIEDCEIDGHPIKAGQLVMTVLAAANRDPARFEDPHRLDVSRSDNRHLARVRPRQPFLSGVAAGTARRRGGARRVALRRFPHFEGPQSPPDWHRSMLLRGPVSLPLRLVPH